VGYGAQESIEKQIGSLGTNMIMIMPGASAAGGVNQGAATFNRLTPADYEKLQRESMLLNAISPVVFTQAQAISGAGNWRTRIQGVSTDYQTIRDWPVDQGTFFTEADLRSARKVAILGTTVAKSLFPGGDPIGQQMQIRDVPFIVQGVLRSKGQNAGGNDADDIILVPFTTAQSRLSGRQRVNQIIASTSSQQDVPAAQEEIRSILRESHKLGEGDDDDFTIRNQDEIAAAASSTTKVMTLLLAAIASISLLVGGIGIMNIMLATVIERTREVGIRRALGAKKRDITRQFLAESVVLSVLGGLLGILGGAFCRPLTLVAREALFHWFPQQMANVPKLIQEMEPALIPWSIPLAFAISVFVGVVFGVYPAARAASLDPIEALRHE
jgi:putative ABC transport system permease protein